MNQVWAIPFAVLMLVAVMGLGVPGATPAVDPKMVPGDVAWMLTATGLVLLMTPGLSFFYGGMVRLKNVISTMLQSFIALGVISILWVVVGFSLAFGESIGGAKFGLIGNPFTYFMFRGVGSMTHPDLAPT